jgi:MoaA/NifB/PqqE/SkfB family radical SAM enzyme
MNCRMTRGIYLRANGEINCYCSTGEQISLAQLPLHDFNFNFIGDYYLNHSLQHIRQSFQDDKLPFPAYCLKCNYLEPFGEFEWAKVSSEIEWAHLEAAAACNLRCPFCVHGIPFNRRKYTRNGPRILPTDLYDKIIRDIAAAGMNIKWMYFSGRGEPGLHPDLWPMVATGKECFDTNFLVNTNGNIAFDDRIVHCGLDKIKIAIDSIDAATYARYRVNGDLQKVIALTEKIANARAKRVGAKPEIIWQKVMFSFNDSDEELVAYQRKALSCGVDTIKFVYTWTKDFSKRRPKDLPRIFPNIEILDTLAKSNLTVAEMDYEIKSLPAKEDVPGIIRFIGRILHWFELGTEDRDHYDSFASLKFSDERLYVLRRSDPLADFYRMALKDSMVKLSEVYLNKGARTESRKYKKFGESIPTAI